jgi:hypothetical protein
MTLTRLLSRSLMAVVTPEYPDSSFANIVLVIMVNDGTTIAEIGPLAGSRTAVRHCTRTDADAQRTDTQLDTAPLSAWAIATTMRQLRRRQPGGGTMRHER